MKKEIIKFLDSKKLKYREDENDFQLDCIFCDDTKKRLGINKESGAWHCFRASCSKSGKKFKSLEYGWDHRTDIKSEKDNEEEKKSTIKKDFHKILHSRIFRTKKYDSARYIVKHRNLSKEVIKHFKLGTRTTFLKKSGDKYNAGEHLAIPYIADGRCVNVKYRALDPESDMKWRREKGGVSALFNQDVINDLDYDWIAITESEIDAMSLWHLGVKNVVGLTVGAKGFKQDWYDKLKRYKRIYLVLDNDEAGREGSEMLARRLGLGKCFNVQLPEGIKDPNDYIAKHDLEHFKKLLKAAKRFKVRGARSLRNMMERSIQKKFYEEKEENKEFYDTPWKRVNNVLGPMRPGHLFILCGKPKCFHEDTKIYTSNGLITIREAVESKTPTTYSYNAELNQVERKKISEWKYSGVLDCLKITTESGKSISVTEDHELMSLVMTKAKDLSVGDNLRVFNRINSYTSNETRTTLEQIIKIEKIGEHPCYDVTVPSNGTLIANDIVSSNSGKSSLALNLMDYWGGKRINSALYSCEMNEMSIADKFTMMKCRTAESIEALTKADVHQAMAKLPLDRMNFYYPERKELKGDLDSIEGVMVKIEEMVQRYGTKIFIFDNLHFLCRGENEKTLLDTATQQFKLLAEELNILIVLVAHPRKTNSNKQLTTDDMKGSSSLFQDADVVWLMFRKAIDGNVTPDEIDGKTTGSMSERADISITGRWTEGGNTFLAFDGKHSSFKDSGIKFRKLVEELKKSKKRKNRGI